MSKLITFKQFSEEFAISRSSIYRLANRGIINLVHIGRAVRIRREDAERWYASLAAAND